MLFNPLRIRELYEMGEKQRDWIGGLEEKYYKAPVIMISLIHKDWIEVIIDDLAKNELLRYPISEEDDWDWEMERKFDEYCRSTLVWQTAVNVGKTVSHMAKKSGIKLCRTNTAIDLANIYYVLHRGNPKEILYKAGLAYLAIELDLMEDFDMLATSPTKIFDGLSMRTLCALNTEQGSKLLRSKKNRKKLLEMQNKASWVFETELTEAQVLFLQDHIYVGTAEELLSKYKKVARLFRRGMIDDKYWYGQYKRYAAMEKRVSGIFTLSDKGYDKDWASWSRHRRRTEDIYKAIYEGNKKWEDILFEQACDHQEYEYTDDEYSIYFPRSAAEFCEEGVAQSSCIIKFLEYVANKDTKIMFLRRKQDLEKSFVTVEICDGYICQALGKFNKEPDKKTEKWLSDYARDHKLVIQEDAFSPAETYY